MFAIRDNINGICREVLKKEFSLESIVNFDIPLQEGRGDLSSSIALQVAKKVGKKPQEIANILAAALRNHADIAAVDAMGGYVNVTLSSSILLKGLSSAEEACIPIKKRKAAPIIVEYSQPNIAKPLGVHHMIGTVMGQTVANLYRHAGYEVIAWNYIGDWGTQFGKLAVAYQKWGNGKPVSDHSIDELLRLYVRFHDEAKKDATLEGQGREAFRKLEQGDTNLRTFWRNVVDVTKTSLANVYKRLHVSFDVDLGESFYEDKMDSILEEGKKKKVFTTGKEGALIVEFPEETKMPPYLVLKGDGATLYSTRDLAQMRYRIDTYHPKAIYIFTDIAQKLHFEQLVATCSMLGWELPEFENVLFGRMRFADASMSTRTGNILNLEHVLNEAVAKARELIEERGDAIQTDDAPGLSEMMGVGALVYGILSQNRKMDIVFDWKKALTFDGNSAPYLQYTHARAMSVLRKSGHSSSAMPMYDAALTGHERALTHALMRFPEILESARTEKMPHKLATYLYALSQAFNAFYNADPILTAEECQKDLRLFLTSLTVRVLKCGTALLTLSVPDRM